MLQTLLMDKYFKMSKYVTVAWILYLTVNFVDSEKEEQDGIEHAKCFSVTQFTVLPILNNYFADIISVMTGIMTMVPYIDAHDSTDTNNHIIDLHQLATKQGISDLLVNVFNPSMEIDTVHFVHEDTFHSRNISLKRFNGTLIKQQHLSECSTTDPTCFSSHDMSSSKRITVSSSQFKPQIQWKLYCDHLNPDVVVKANLQLRFTEKNINKNKHTNAKR